MKDLPPETFVISERVFLYAIGATLLVTLAVALGCGTLALFTMRELSTARDALVLSRDNAAICHDALIRSDARREQLESLLEIAASRRKALPMGGN